MKNRRVNVLEPETAVRLGSKCLAKLIWQSDQSGQDLNFRKLSSAQPIVKMHAAKHLDPRRTAVSGSNTLTRRFFTYSLYGLDFEQTQSDSFWFSDAFGMGWDKIVKLCHGSLKSLTPNQQRPFEETKEIILDSFENFKADAKISKKLNLIHFSSLLKHRVQSRLTAVAAISSASSGAGADAGHKSCRHLYRQTDK